MDHVKIIDEYIEKMEKAQNYFLEFLENENNSEENFQNLINFIVDFKIQENQQDLKEFLHLLFNILNNHKRLPNFFSKIEQIVQYVKEDIKKYFNNSEIFNIFKDDKRILLFLYEEKMFEFDEIILKKFLFNDKYEKYDYITYFRPEIKEFLAKEQNNINDKIYVMARKKTYSGRPPIEFYDKRRIGENDNPICQIIQKDDIKEFIELIKQKKISIQKTVINYSRYETNSFIIEMQNRSGNETKLIEYAAFNGSIQIFSYLKKKGVKLTSSLWNFAIHGNNADIIHILEENQVKPYNSFFDVFKEALKCHHNSIAKYLEEKYLKNNESKDYSQENLLIYSLKYHNYAFIKKSYINQSSLIYLYRYDYPSFVKIILEIKVDKNEIQY